MYFSGTTTIFIEEKKIEEIFIYLETHGNENKLLNKIKKTAAVFQQKESIGKNLHTTESKDSKILINDCNPESPNILTEYTSPLVSTSNQISIDIISPQNIIKTNQSPQKIIFPDTKTELYPQKKLTFEKEKSVFEELTLGHLFLIERKPLFEVYILVIILLFRDSPWK